MNSYQLYNDIAIDTDVMSASPHRLIQLLIDKAIQHLETAKMQTERNEIILKCQTVDKCLDIIAHLRGSLNFQMTETKIMASDLDTLYTFVQNRLLKASISNKLEFYNECKAVLLQVKEGWEGIKEKVEANNA
jgi:flagellar secretion chaperone FliS